MALAQATSQTASQTAMQTAMLVLPDAPDAALIGGADAPAGFSTSAGPSFDRAPGQRASAQRPMASPFDSVILPSEQAPALTARDKFLMGARSTVTPFSMAGWFLSSGYSHLTNGAPNYGTDKGAYGQRLGAAAIRSSSEDIFTTSVMANVFHEDPRYYQMGRSHSIRQRIVYAATRVLVTRSDSGKATVNLALLTGNLAGAALTNAYYPPRNHGFGQTMLIFGSSLGGSALGFGVNEFLNDALRLAHLKKGE